MLSEQHVAGGCLLGDEVDKGLEDSAKTGRVLGTSNLCRRFAYCASPTSQNTNMTAKQLYSANKKKKNNCY